MGKVERLAVYFSEPGPRNTEDVVNAVLRRLQEGDLSDVIVANTSGRTGAEFAEALRGKARVIAVSYERMERKFKDKIAEAGGVALDGTHLPLHESGMDDVRKSFYALGQGFKVAVEVILIAADKGVIDLCKDVIGVGGSGRGADTAIVARATLKKTSSAGTERRSLK